MPQLLVNSICDIILFVKTFILGNKMDCNQSINIFSFWEEAITNSFDLMVFEDGLLDFVDDIKTANLSLEELRDLFIKIEQISDPFLEDQKKSCLRIIEARAADKIQGQRSYFLQEAKKMNHLKTNFFKCVLNTHYKLLIGQQYPVIPLKFVGESLRKNQEFLQEQEDALFLEPYSRTYHRIPLWEMEHPMTGAKGLLCGSLHYFPTTKSNDMSPLFTLLAKECHFLAVELFINSDDPKIVEEWTEKRKGNRATLNKTVEKVSSLIDKNKQNFKQRFALHPTIPYVEEMKNPNYGLEEQLLKQAIESNLPIESLETIEAHVERECEILAKDYSSIDDWYDLTSSGLLAVEEEFICLLDQYNHYESVIHLTQLVYGEYIKNNIVKSNIQFVNSIHQKMSNTPNAKGLYVIGFAHVVGEEGVKSHLERKGYRFKSREMRVFKNSIT